MKNGEEGNGAKSLLKPHFTGTIDLGHILQILGVAGGVTAAVFGSYLFVNGRLAEQGESIRSLQSQIVDLRARQKEADDDRRQLAKDLSSSMENIRVTFTASMENIRITLTDVRLLVARISDGVRK